MMDRRQWLKGASAIAASAAMPLRPARAAMEPIKRLLFVHGRAQGGFNPVDLKATWMATLQRGAQKLGRTVPDVDVAFPFYGKVLDDYANAAEIPLTVEGARGGTSDEQLQEIQREFAEGAQAKGLVTTEQIDSEFTGQTGDRGPLNWAWVQATLRAVDKYGGNTGNKTLETFTRDVYLYTTRAGVRDDIDRIVSSMLTEEPTLVVGHSLGSVVAYSVLRRDTRNLKVPLYVTVGCPLAVRSIRKQFSPLRYPSPLSGWYNAFDPRDTVALYPLDRDNFPVSPSIDNYSQVNNPTDNRHGIIGYLDDPDVARHILDALGG
jgi:hypothetical protein